MKCYSYQASLSSPLGCRGESWAIQDNIFKCPMYWAFQQSLAIFIVPELLLLRDSLPVFSELSQFLPMWWRSAPHPCSLHLQLSYPKAQPHTRCSWQSRGRRSELPAWCWALAQDYFEPCVPVAALPVPCTLSQGDTLPRLPASSTTVPVLLLRYEVLPPPVPPGLAGVRVTSLDMAVEDQLSWPCFPFALIVNKSLLPTKISCLTIFT